MAYSIFLFLMMTPFFDYYFNADMMHGFSNTLPSIKIGIDDGLFSRRLGNTANYALRPQ